MARNYLMTEETAHKKAVHSRIDLNGVWRLHGAGETESIPAQVPGCVHMDLLAANKIGDPFWGLNEATLKESYDTDWVYERTFDVEASFLEQSRILLCCEGLDTIAEIMVNNHFVSSTDNMFRYWEFDVKSLLRIGTNQIHIRFTSPISYIAERQKIRPLHYPTAPHQIASFSQIRKAAFSFGWDWGPCIPTSGIWRPIFLQAISAERLQDIAIRQDHSTPGHVELEIAIGAESMNSSQLHTRVKLTFQGELIAQDVCTLNGGKGQCRFFIKDPQLWWPRGLGEQSLYDIHVELTDETSKIIDTWSRRIGLRTLKLVRGSDAWGESFTFHANGVPFFAKGTNWVPADALLPRLTSEDYHRLLTAAAAAHMNMIRVWGGGIYEPDIFYDLCDELGLCVWQDFMFACAPYPLDNLEFVTNACLEIEQQIKRLRHHASLVLWCGNNELESCGFVAVKGDEGHMALADYRAFFEKRIPALIREFAPEQSYWPGSPYKEPGDPYNPDVWIDSPRRGDSHNWSVWHVKKPFEFYEECNHRFLSEFGLQSYPEPSAIRRFSGEEISDVQHPVMIHHQRCSGGNDRIQEYLLEWFREPKDFESTLWCSQILHGLAMKIGCEHWRRGMPGTMGTLIWQLNDAWPTTSGAAIDYYGNWKALHYMTRRFFSPLLVSAVEKEGVVQVYATSDLPEPVKCSLQWQLTDLHGSVLRNESMDLTIPSSATIMVEKLDFENEKRCRSTENLLLWLFLVKETEIVSKNLVFFAKPKALELPNPELSYEVSDSHKDSFTVVVKSKYPALWIWFELPNSGVQCSDNFFHMQANDSITVRVSPTSSMTYQQFSQQLRIGSLYDTY